MDCSLLTATGAPGRPRLKSKDVGSARDKQKSGKDEVSGREAVPLCVVHLSLGLVASIVVYDDDEGNGEAAHNAGREPPLDRCVGSCRTGHE